MCGSTLGESGGFKAAQEAIDKKDLKMFDNCEGCGKVGVKAIINWAIKNDFDTKILNYCTSADVTKDKSRVVGYASALIGI